MFNLLKVGHCYHPEAVVMKGHSWKSMKFPAVVGLIKHPKYGYILFDTGYAKRFLTETKQFPEIFYRWLTPMHLCDKEGLVAQLKVMDIPVDEIKYIFISHFHADHISGLLDFPRALFICSKVALNTVLSSNRLAGLMKGYLPGLLPDNFIQRCTFIEDTTLVKLGVSFTPFNQAYDIFNDGSYLAVSLPGHASGQYGLMLEHEGRSRFLVGDACWTREAYQDGARPNKLAHVIMDDANQYLETLDKLSQLYLANTKLQIIPSHCQYSFDEFIND